MREQVGELLAQEGRDDGGRCLVGPQAVGVGGAHDAGLEQSVVAVHAHERLDDEGHEAEVVLRRLPRCVQQHAVVGGEAPVVVLARAVDALEGFLVEQHLEAVLACHLLHEAHEQHVVVDGQVGLLEDGRELKLVGGHLVVACLAGDAQLQGLDLEVFHEGLHALGDGAEVVVVHLLVLGRVVAHERSTGEQQVGTCRAEAVVDEEILLLPAQVGLHLPHLGVEEAGHIGGCRVEGMERAQQRSLVVEGLAGVGDEDGGDAERVVDDEHGRRGVPGRVAAGLEGVADAAGGEARGIGLLLHQELARELFDHATLAVVLHKGIVLLGRAVGEGLEPVGVMGHTTFLGPLAHALGHGICDAPVEVCAVVDDIDELLVDVRRKILVHLLAIENLACEIL